MVVVVVVGIRRRKGSGSGSDGRWSPLSTHHGERERAPGVGETKTSLEARQCRGTERR